MIDSAGRALAGTFVGSRTSQFTHESKIVQSQNTATRIVLLKL